MAVTERLKNAWGAFRGTRDPTEEFGFYVSEISSSSKPDRTILTRGGSKTIVSSVYNQIGVDCSSIDIVHARLNENGEFMEVIRDDLNYALTKQANIDQTGRDLIRDAVITMLDTGCVAIVPTVTDDELKEGDTRPFEVCELRRGEITEWSPKQVRVNLYNDKTGITESFVFEKDLVAIIENPFYCIMNEPNSTAQRLLRVLSQLDQFNSEINPTKLDLLIQTPYPIKTEAEEQRALRRKRSIENQLNNSRLGIAYIGQTEKVIQLNRSLENNLWEQAKDLQEQLFNQLGFSQSIFDGTADEKTMLNYYNRTVEPIMSAITENMERKWIGRNAILQGQGIRFYRSPFKLVPVTQMAEIADKFTRNEIATSNEIRSAIGMRRSDDPKADMLINSNLNQSKQMEEQIAGDRNSNKEK